MTVISPLTNSENVTRLETIAAEDIVSLWKDMLGLDISEELSAVGDINYCECSTSGLRFFSPMTTGSEKFYEMLQKYEWYYLEEKKEYDIAAPYVRADDSVLEVGCGRGAFAAKINTRAYIGLEFSQVAKSMAATAGLDVRTESVERHSEKYEEKYDVVCSFQVLEHVSAIRSFIHACVRCLKPGGQLIYSVPSADSYVALQANSILNMPPHHVSHWPETALRFVANEFGLSVQALEFEQLSDVHVRSFANVLCTTAIDNLLNRKQVLVDCSRRAVLVRRVARAIGYLLAKGLQDQRMRPRGHSVTVVFRKN